MNSHRNKNLESLLLDVLDSTQKLEDQIALDEFDPKLVNQLVSDRGVTLQRFSLEYQSITSDTPNNDKYLETFTKIYSQVIKKHQELVDNINIKMNSISQELSSISKERKMRSSYTANNFAKKQNNSLLITSKIQG